MLLFIFFLGKPMGRGKGQQGGKQRPGKSKRVKAKGKRK